MKSRESVLPVVALVLGLLSSWGLAAWQQRAEQARTTDALQAAARAIAAQLADRLHALEQVLAGVRGLALTLGWDRVTREHFVRYGSTLGPDTTSAGVQGIGLVRRVQAVDEARFAADAAADGWPGFAVRALAPHDGERYVIQYMEPASANRSAVGLDLASGVAQRAAAQTALHSGQAALSAPLTEPDAEGKPRATLLLLLPVFAGAGMPADATQRQAQALGWAVALLQAHELLHPVAAAAPAEVRFSVADALGGAPFFTSGAAAAGEAVAQLDLPAAGRRWRVEVRPAAAPRAAPSGAAPLYTGALGALASVLLAAALWQAGLRRKSLQQLEAERSVQAGQVALLERQVAERKGELDTALRESADLLRTLNAHFLVSTADADGHITAVNDTFCQVSGYSRAELIGQTHRILSSHTHDYRVWEAMWSTIRRGEHWRSEVCNRTKSGQLYWVSSVIAPITGADGRVERYVSIRTDVTSRRLAEDALRESHKRFALAAEAAGFGIWDYDPRSGTASWDENMYRLFGRDFAAEAQPLTVWTNSVHPEDRVAVAQALAAAIEGRAPFEAGFRIVHADGEVRHIRALARVERNADGAAERMTGVCMDVTAQATAMQALQASNAELEQFAYVASHDLQEPLRMVVSYTELLAQRYAGKLDERADKYIHYASDGGRRMQRLVADLLTYSRVGSQGKPLVPVPTGAILEQVLQGLQLRVREAAAVIDAGPLPTVLGDASQLGMVFQNLIANGIKFRGEQPPRIRIEAQANGYLWQFSVSDNGIGIDMKYAERIFQMFQRLHARDAYEGSGIGLAVVRRIVERHGGRVWVEAQPGRGSTFHFTLRAA